MPALRPRWHMPSCKLLRDASYQAQSPVTAVKRRDEGKLTLLCTCGRRGLSGRFRGSWKRKRSGKALLPQLQCRVCHMFADTRWVANASARPDAVRQCSQKLGRWSVRPPRTSWARAICRPLRPPQVPSRAIPAAASTTTQPHRAKRAQSQRIRPAAGQGGAVRPHSYASQPPTHVLVPTVASAAGLKSSTVYSSN